MGRGGSRTGDLDVTVAGEARTSVGIGGGAAAGAAREGGASGSTDGAGTGRGATNGDYGGGAAFGQETAGDNDGKARDGRLPAAAGSSAVASSTVGGALTAVTPGGKEGNDGVTEMDVVDKNGGDDATTIAPEADMSASSPATTTVVDSLTAANGAEASNNAATVMDVDNGLPESAAGGVDGNGAATKARLDTGGGVVGDGERGASQAPTGDVMAAALLLMGDPSSGQQQQPQLEEDQDGQEQRRRQQQPTMCREHAGPGWVDVVRIGGDGGGDANGDAAGSQVGRGGGRIGIRGGR